MSLDRYQNDIDKLVRHGKILLIQMAIELKINVKTDLDKSEIDKLSSLTDSYQSWYSEALACVRQLLPDRVDDFVAFYKPAKLRKEITYANYTISDYLQGLNITRGYLKETVVGPDAAFPALRQQVQIVESIKRRFESALFDIRALVQADFFDDELDAAEELNKKGYHRAAGALCGVVLEEHLATISDQHKISHGKNPTIGELNDLLKKSEITDIPTWRNIQRLGDIRNLCDHKKSVEPSKDNIEELIGGVRKIIKTVF